MNPAATPPNRRDAHREREGAGRGSSIHRPARGRGLYRPQIDTTSLLPTPPSLFAGLLARPPPSPLDFELPAAATTESGERPSCGELMRDDAACRFGARSSVVSPLPVGSGSARRRARLRGGGEGGDGEDVRKHQREVGVVGEGQPLRVRLFRPGEAPPLRRAGNTGRAPPRPLFLPHVLLLQWRGSSTNRLHSRREGLQMCITSLLDCNFATPFASSGGGYAFVNSSSGRCKNAFAHRCWTQPKVTPAPKVKGDSFGDQCPGNQYELD
jgi:hypothetical protein